MLSSGTLLPGATPVCVGLPARTHPRHAVSRQQRALCLHTQPQTTNSSLSQHTAGSGAHTQQQRPNKQPHEKGDGWVRQTNAAEEQHVEALQPAERGAQSQSDREHGLQQGQVSESPGLYGKFLTEELLSCPSLAALSFTLFSAPATNLNAIHVAAAYRRLAQLRKSSLRLPLSDEDSHHHLASLFQTLDTLALQHCHSMRPRELSGILWAAASADHVLQPAVLNRLMQEFLRQFDSCNEIDVSNAVWSLVKHLRSASAAASLREELLEGQQEGALPGRVPRVGTRTSERASMQGRFLKHGPGAAHVSSTHHRHHQQQQQQQQQQEGGYHAHESSNFRGGPVWQHQHHLSQRSTEPLPPPSPPPTATAAAAAAPAAAPVLTDTGVGARPWSSTDAAPLRDPTGSLPAPPPTARAPSTPGVSQNTPLPQPLQSHVGSDAARHAPEPLPSAHAHPPPQQQESLKVPLTPRQAPAHPAPANTVPSTDPTKPPSSGNSSSSTTTNTSNSSSSSFTPGPHVLSLPKFHSRAPSLSPSSSSSSSNGRPQLLQRPTRIVHSDTPTPMPPGLHSTPLHTHARADTTPAVAQAVNAPTSNTITSHSTSHTLDAASSGHAAHTPNVAAAASDVQPSATDVQPGSSTQRHPTHPTLTQHPHSRDSHPHNAENGSASQLLRPAAPSPVISTKPSTSGTNNNTAAQRSHSPSTNTHPPSPTHTLFQPSHVPPRASSFPPSSADTNQHLSTAALWGHSSALTSSPPSSLSSLSSPTLSPSPSSLSASASAAAASTAADSTTQPHHLPPQQQHYPQQQDNPSHNHHHPHSLTPHPPPTTQPHLDQHIQYKHHHPWLPELLARLLPLLPSLPNRPMVVVSNSLVKVPHLLNVSQAQLVIEQLLRRSHTFGAQDLANMLASMARVDYRPSESQMRSIAGKVAERLPTFKGDEIAIVLHSFAKLHYLPAWHLLHDMCRMTSSQLSKCSISHLVLMTWSFCKLRWRPPAQWLELLVTEVCEREHELQDLELATLLFGLGALGHRLEQPEAYVLLGRMMFLAEQGSSSPWQLASYITSAVRLRIHIPPSMSKPLLRACYRALPRFSNVGLAYMLWGVAKLSVWGDDSAKRRRGKMRWEVHGNWLIAVDRQVHARVPTLCPTSAPIILWSLAKLHSCMNRPSPSWISYFWQAVVRLLPFIEPRGLVAMLHATLWLRFAPHPRVLQEVALYISVRDSSLPSGMHGVLRMLLYRIDKIRAEKRWQIKMESRGLHAPYSLLNAVRVESSLLKRLNQHDPLQGRQKQQVVNIRRERSRLQRRRRARLLLGLPVSPNRGGSGTHTDSQQQQQQQQHQNRPPQPPKQQQQQQQWSAGGTSSNKPPKTQQQIAQHTQPKGLQQAPLHMQQQQQQQWQQPANHHQQPGRQGPARQAFLRAQQHQQQQRQQRPRQEQYQQRRLDRWRRKQEGLLLRQASATVEGLLKQVQQHRAHDQEQRHRLQHIRAALAILRTMRASRMPRTLHILRTMRAPRMPRTLHSRSSSSAMQLSARAMPVHAVHASPVHLYEGRHHERYSGPTSLAVGVSKQAQQQQQQQQPLHQRQHPRQRQLHEKIQRAGLQHVLPRELQAPGWSLPVQHKLGHGPKHGPEQAVEVQRAVRVHRHFMHQLQQQQERMQGERPLLLGQVASSVQRLVALMGTVQRRGGGGEGAGLGGSQQQQQQAVHGVQQQEQQQQVVQQGMNKVQQRTPIHHVPPSLHKQQQQQQQQQAVQQGMDSVLQHARALYAPFQNHEPQPQQQQQHEGSQQDSVQHCSSAAVVRDPLDQVVAMMQRLVRVVQQGLHDGVEAEGRPQGQRQAREPASALSQGLHNGTETKGQPREQRQARERATLATAAHLLTQLDAHMRQLPAVQQAGTAQRPPPQH